MPTVSACPDLMRYQQLAAGQLAQADEEALLVHLERCQACGQKQRLVSGIDDGTLRVPGE